MLGNFIIPFAKRKTETQGKRLACGLSAQRLEGEASGFRCKPCGSRVSGKAVASFGEWGWCLVSSSPHGHKRNIFCLFNGTRGPFPPAPLPGLPKGSQQESSWGKFAQYKLLREGVRGVGGDHIGDRWHFFGLSSGMG